MLVRPEVFTEVCNQIKVFKVAARYLTASLPFSFKHSRRRVHVSPKLLYPPTTHIASKPQKIMI
jgi:hypothetical protein